jgi:hypothetical protein
MFAESEKKILLLTFISELFVWKSRRILIRTVFLQGPPLRNIWMQEKVRYNTDIICDFQAQNQRFRASEED